MIGKNNPLNVRYNPLNKWKGQIGQTKGFCDFSDILFGLRAGCYLIFKSYKNKNVVTISQIINRFAPPSENKTQDYIDFVCKVTYLLPFDVPTSEEEKVHLIQAMCLMETGFKPYYHKVVDILKSLKL